MIETTRIPRDLATEAEDRRCDAEWDDAEEWAAGLTEDNVATRVSLGIVLRPTWREVAVALTIFALILAWTVF